MRDPRYRPLWVAGALALAGGLVVTLPSPSQSQTMGANTSLVAVSSVENQHIHSLAFRSADLDGLIARLNSDSDTIQIESSSSWNGSGNGTNPGAGLQHSHTVRFNKQQLTTLRDTGTVTVQSEVASGHRHNFEFIKENECAAVGVPVVVVGPPGPPGPPGPTQTVTVTPEPSVSVSVSPSPSPSVSVSPSPSVSVSPSETPSQTPSETPSETPTTAPSSSPQPTYTILGTSAPEANPTATGGVEAVSSGGA